MNAGPTTLEELAEILAITQLKARYFRLLDAQRWAQWRRLFTDDAAFDVAWVNAEPGRIDTDAFVARLSAGLHGARTVHQGHLPIIELTGPDHARGIWPMFDYVELVAREGRRRGKMGFGYYHERYRREHGEWRIEWLRLERLREAPLDGMAIVAGPEGRARDDWLAGTVAPSPDQLVDVEAIVRLKGRHLRLMDAKRWADWRELFADDARFYVDTNPATADALVADVAARITLPAVHDAHPPEIGFLPNGEARAIWPAEHCVELPNHAPRPSFIGWGSFEEQYRRDHGRWRITSLRRTYLRADPLSEPVRTSGGAAADSRDGDPGNARFDDRSPPAPERLIDAELIRRLQAGCLRWLDTGELPSGEGLFTADAHVSWNTAGERTPEQLGAELAQRRRAGAVLVHHAHAPELAFDDGDRAHGVWTISDWSSPPGRPAARDVNYASLHVDYRRDQDRWRIASMLSLPLLSASCP